MDSSETISAQKTAVFRFHNPSKRKRAILHDAMARSHRAYGALVRALLARLDEIEAVEQKTQRGRFMQDRIVYPTRRGWPLPASAEACARIDAMAAVESYVQQKRERPKASPPKVEALQTIQPEYEAALDNLAALGGTDREQENALRDELNRTTRTPHPRPLGLYGYKWFYRLLRHPRTGRLYTWINLRPQKGRFTPKRSDLKADLKTRQVEQMVDVSTGEIILCDKVGWVLFPLEFGFDYHDRRFLAQADPKGARLVYKPEVDRYELHVMFEYVQPLIHTKRFVGVDRGIYNLAAWSVIEADGQTVDNGQIEGMSLRFVQQQYQLRVRKEQRRGKIVRRRKRRAYGDEAVHVTANELVRIAERHKARLVLEELQMRRVHARPKFTPRSGFNAILGRQQYQKLKQVLEYKTRVRGLPPPVYVGAAFTSQTCPECGHVARENRPKRPAGDGSFEMSSFHCQDCGYRADADVNAARVIGLKGAWLTQLPTRKTRGGRDLREAEKFPQYLLDAARQRQGSSEGGTPSSVPS
jgi:IS605 OrfB family transposase